MSFHNSPEHNTPEIVAGLKCYGMETDKPSQLADAFRLGFLSAQPDWKPMRCAECNCEFGGADCNWIKTPKFGEDQPND